jgi:Outer membrane efflux protein
MRRRRARHPKRGALIIFGTVKTTVVLLSALTAVGCASLPRNGEQIAIKGIGQYETAQSFTAPVTTSWPADAWWKSYGDAQLDTLVDEALANSPTLAVADARLRRARSLVDVAGAANKPQVNANAAATEQKQTYNYLSPPAFTPRGWKDYGRATLDLTWDLDLWGKNRAALAAATSEAEATRADAAQARITLAAAVASSYAELAREHAALDTAIAARDVRLKPPIFSASASATASKPPAACDKSSRASPAPKPTCSRSKSNSRYRRTASPRSWAPARTAASRSRARR